MEKEKNILKNKLLIFEGIFKWKKKWIWNRI